MDYKKNTEKFEKFREKLNLYLLGVVMLPCDYVSTIFCSLPCKNAKISYIINQKDTI